MNDFVPEADGNVVKVDSTAHAQPSMAHKQPHRSLGIWPQAHSENLTTYVNALFQG